MHVRSFKASGRVAIASAKGRHAVPPVPPGHRRCRPLDRIVACVGATICIALTVFVCAGLDLDVLLLLAEGHAQVRRGRSAASQ
ncbi:MULTISPECIES: hypothetical protein [unclassified Sphingomonas]|uniref:hypothetical protein n=1 Tax=unclassified Sphingomonas TaxID=196159 RepID=UPI0021506CE9|nr:MULTISPECIES: hypothetical protein [unclassified Sphingomonas]MCR5871597.1 hypothetical protein [Sphingomonas sp. J344]UUY00110.1 hypothetical protein LRS08_02960 [Sphingomonas sp. J315]